MKSKRVLRRCGRRCASRPIWVKCGHISHERTRTDGESRRRPGRNYPLFIAKRLRRGKKVQEEIIDEARPQGRRPCFSTSRFEYRAASLARIGNELDPGTRGSSLREPNAIAWHVARILHAFPRKSCASPIALAEIVVRCNLCRSALQ